MHGALFGDVVIGRPLYTVWARGVVPVDTRPRAGSSRGWRRRAQGGDQGEFGARSRDPPGGCRGRSPAAAGAGPFRSSGGRCHVPLSQRRSFPGPRASRCPGAGHACPADPRADRRPSKNGADARPRDRSGSDRLDRLGLRSGELQPPAPPGGRVGSPPRTRRARREARADPTRKSPRRVSMRPTAPPSLTVLPRVRRSPAGYSG